MAIIANRQAAPLGRRSPGGLQKKRRATAKPEHSGRKDSTMATDCPSCSIPSTCDHWTPARCTAAGEVWLYAPDGNRVPMGKVCQSHAAACIAEYQAKLGEEWTARPCHHAEVVDVPFQQTCKDCRADIPEQDIFCASCRSVRNDLNAWHI